MELRIQKTTTHYSSIYEEIEYQVQKKVWWGWKNINLPYATFEFAQEYLHTYENNNGKYPIVTRNIVYRNTIHL
jgi:hypothetical protein